MKRIIIPASLCPADTWSSSQKETLFFSLIVISSKASTHVAYLLNVCASSLHWAPLSHLLLSERALRVNKKMACLRLLLNLLVCLFLNSGTCSSLEGQKFALDSPVQRRLKLGLNIFSLAQDPSKEASRLGMKNLFIWDYILSFSLLVSLAKCHKVKTQSIETFKKITRFSQSIF